MKKKYFFVYIFALFFLQISFNSCSSDPDEDIMGNEDIEQEQEEGEGGGDVVVDPSYSIAEQKEKLEKTGLALADYMDSKRFDYLLDLTNYVYQKYIDDYDTDNVSEWLEDCLDLITTHIKKNTEHDLITNEYKRYFLAANFTGHFTASNGKWTYKKANDLQFTFKDENNNTCVVSLKTKGKVVKVKMTDQEDWYYLPSNGYGDYKQYVDIYHLYLGLPENIVVELTQNGKSLVNVTLNSDVNAIGNEFDLSTDHLTTDLVANIQNYQFNLEQLVLNNNLVKCKFNYKEDSNTILSVIAEAEGNFENEKAKEVKFTMNLLGEVQIKGNCKNLSSVVNYLEDAEETNNMKELESYMISINDMINTGIYYDNKDKRQATIKFDIISEEDYNYQENYLTPIIVFNEDGSQYSTLEIFFNENDFKDLLDKIDRIFTDYDNRF